MLGNLSNPLIQFLNKKKKASQKTQNNQKKVNIQ